MFKFGIESKEKLKIANSFLADKASVYVKLWQASGYSGQDDYLKSIGSPWSATRAPQAAGESCSIILLPDFTNENRIELQDSG